MLRKYTYLATLLLICFLIHPKERVEAKWEKVVLSQLLEPDLYLTKDRIRIKIAEIDLAKDNEITPANQCYQPELRQFLKFSLIDRPTKIKWSQVYPSTDIYRQAQIKTSDNEDLALKLLRRGWAEISFITDETDKTYLEAQKAAQKNRLGLWGECDNWFKLRERNRLAGKTTYLPKESKTYLDAVSYGWVRKIIEPHIYELESGQRIELQAVRPPSASSEVYACWKKSLMPELERLLLGKKVRLEADQLHLSSRGRKLKRYVWLEGNRWQSPLLINQWLLESNSARLNEAELNLKYVDVLREASAVKTLPSWWGQCAGELINKSVAEESAVKPVLVFDEACPIKGNISGSKKNLKKTYHTPLSGWYKRIEAEQCFADEKAAETAGFIKVK